MANTRQTNDANDDDDVDSSTAMRCRRVADMPACLIIRMAVLSVTPSAQ